MLVANATFLLVRHGETEWNATHRWQGFTGPPLNEIGLLQAQELGRNLASTRLDAIYSSVHDLEWGPQIGTGRTRVVLGKARVGPLEITDAMVFELADDGRIKGIRPHLRPWAATTLFSLVLARRLAAHPGVLWRAFRR